MMFNEEESYRSMASKSVIKISLLDMAASNSSKSIKNDEDLFSNKSHQSLINPQSKCKKQYLFEQDQGTILIGRTNECQIKLKEAGLSRI
jgi:hypothetical protein